MMSCIFFFQVYVSHLALHSFPTRRSSDLSRTESPAVRFAPRARLRRARAGEALEISSSVLLPGPGLARRAPRDRKSTRLNSSHSQISYAVFCLKKKKNYTKKAYHISTTLD